MVKQEWVPAKGKKKSETKTELNTGPLKKRQLLRLANLQPFLASFCQQHRYLSQNLGADGHF